VAAMLLLTLRGTPTIYYGDEIGMAQVPIPPERVHGLGVGRDGCRTPMQWSSEPHAGFSTVDSWLPLASDWRRENVENQRADATVLNLYRRLIALRRSSPALARGAYQPIAASGDLLVFIRAEGDERMLVALNLGGEPVAFELRDRGLKGRLLVSSLGDRDGEAVNKTIDLRSHEGAVIGLDR